MVSTVPAYGVGTYGSARYSAYAMTESVQLSELIEEHRAVPLSAVIHVTDLISKKAISKVIVDYFDLSDVPLKSSSISFSDSFVISSSLNNALNRTLLDSLHLTDIRSGVNSLALIDYFRVSGEGLNVPNGLTSAWLFEGDALDVVDGNNGTVTNASLVSGRHGKINSAYSFNGVNSRIDASRPLSGGSSSFSLWIKPLETLDGIFCGRIYGDNFGVYKNASWGSLVSGNFTFSLATDAEQTGYDVGDYTVGEWYHLVGVINDSSKTVELYKNGVNVGGTHTYSGALRNNVNSMTFGWDGGTKFQNCVLDDVLVYSRAISSVEVQTLYASQLQDNLVKDVSVFKSDEFELFDDVIAFKAFFVNLLDPFNLTSSLSKSMSFAPFVEYLTLDDVLSRKPIKNLYESWVLSDNASAVSVLLKTVNDIFSMSDVKSLDTSLSLSDLLVETDSAGLGFYRELLDSIIENDSSLTKEAIKDLLDSFTLSEALDLLRGKNLLEFWTMNSIGAAEIANPNWIRYSNIEDEFGRASSEKIDFKARVTLMIQPLTEQDREVIGLGVGVTGYMKAYARHTYFVDYVADYRTIDVGDMIVYERKNYLVDQVEGRWGGRSEVFRKLILRRVDND